MSAMNYGLFPWLTTGPVGWLSLEYGESVRPAAVYALTALRGGERWQITS